MNIYSISLPDSVRPESRSTHMHTGRSKLRSIDSMESVHHARYILKISENARYTYPGYRSIKIYNMHTVVYHMHNRCRPILISIAKIKFTPNLFT